MIPMRDGVRLAADIYFPSDDGVKAAPGRFPVLLMRTCYGKEQMPLFYGADTSSGYVLVFQDGRGTYHSEGDFRPMLNEGNDGYDTIAWLAKQPWSDGRIGTFGG